MANIAWQKSFLGDGVHPARFDVEQKKLILLDQRELPEQTLFIDYHSAEEVAEAITDMVVRGAPLIGISAAYGMVLESLEQSSADAFLERVTAAAKRLCAARPTAINLKWAVERMQACAIEISSSSPADRYQTMLSLALEIHRDDFMACETMSEYGAKCVPDDAVVLTHCNAGALATGGAGTALGVIRAAHAKGKIRKVYCCETRPYLQGARLSSWELQQSGVPVEVITDSMTAHFLRHEGVNFVVVGSDRIAANGDVANKIGTYGLAVLCDAHDVPFTVAAPWSTVDLSCASGEAIPIEERSSDEVAWIGGKRFVNRGIHCRHPAFDVTPHALVKAVFTERGTFFPAEGQRPESLL